MNRDGDCLEENVAHLLRVAYGPSARPDPQTSERMRWLLLGRLRVRHVTPGFPDAALATLGALVLILATCVGAQVLLMGAPPGSSPPLLTAATMLVLNLTGVPVASIVIVLRRRHG